MSFDSILKSMLIRHAAIYGVGRYKTCIGDRWAIGGGGGSGGDGGSGDCASDGGGGGRCGGGSGGDNVALHINLTK